MNLFQLFVIVLVVILVLILIFQLFYRRYASSAECHACEEESRKRHGNPADFLEANDQDVVFEPDESDDENISEDDES